MTEFEMAYLFDVHVETIVTILFGYFSITSAFLVATHLAARSLPRLITWVVVALYSVTSVTLVIIVFRYVTAVIGIRDAMVKNGMMWYPAAGELSIFLPLAFYGASSALAAIFVASLWYFRIVRRDGAFELSK